MNDLQLNRFCPVCTLLQGASEVGTKALVDHAICEPTVGTDVTFDTRVTANPSMRGGSTSS